MRAVKMATLLRPRSFCESRLWFRFILSSVVVCITGFARTSAMCRFSSFRSAVRRPAGLVKHFAQIVGRYSDYPMCCTEFSIGLYTTAARFAQSDR